MKIIFVLLYALSAPVFAADNINPEYQDYQELNLDKEVYESVVVYGENLGVISDKIGLMGFGSDQNKGEVDAETERFFKHVRSKKLARALTFALEARGVNTYEDFEGGIIEWLKKILGSKITNAILTLMGIKEFKEHVFGAYKHFLMTKDPNTCPEGLYGLAGDISYITAYVAAWYYMNGPYISHGAGMVAKVAVEYVLEITDGHVKLCAIIHKPDNFIYFRREDDLIFN